MLWLIHHLNVNEWKMQSRIKIMRKLPRKVIHVRKHSFFFCTRLQIKDYFLQDVSLHEALLQNYNDSSTELLKLHLHQISSTEFGRTCLVKLKKLFLFFSSDQYWAHGCCMIKFPRRSSEKAALTRQRPRPRQRQIRITRRTINVKDSLVENVILPFRSH